IGANFGDEGKGLMTDYHAAKSDSVVVRFNGGAQAGHTVVTPDGKRHVFSHIGSGSFAGADTFLSRYFVCNPLLFRKEWDVLSPKCSVPQIHIEAAAIVTTPYDMMINQIAEDLRGNSRHGSCGMGFGETIERCQHAPLALSYADLNDAARLRAKLIKIQKEWLPQRLAALGFADLPDKWRERVASEGILDKFIEDTAFFLQTTTAASIAFLKETAKHIVFEGAQGLMLDQTRGIFPHVTRSNTGLKNVLPLAREAGIGQLDVTYATRAYLTRHGAGPLENEEKDPPAQGIKDDTNVLNDWQGNLRYALLEVETLATFMRDDLSDAGSDIKINPGLAVTCIDQMDELVTYADRGSVTTGRMAGYLDLLKKRTGVKTLLESRGPTRETVTVLAA
ncbi:MAG: putative Adenylosuccinate synthase, partial [Alphaproteobacteria bacterium]|nr:putative Adenylosuccinate synthase [Alphaproteobacteria bacterium]